MKKTKTGCKAGCRAGCCKPKKSNLMTKMDQWHDYLLRGTYILCACLIVYSLMIFNGLAAGNSDVPGNNFFVASAHGLGNVVGDIWSDTTLVINAVGEDFENLCQGTLKNTYHGTGQLFASTGNFLAKVPTIFTTPPYARAVGYR